MPANQELGQGFEIKLLLHTKSGFTEIYSVAESDPDPDNY